MDIDHTTAEQEPNTAKKAEMEAVQRINKRVAVYEKDAKKAKRDEKIVQKNLFSYIERFGKRFVKGLLDSIKFLYNAMTDPRTPFEVKTMAIAALVYLISPIDVIPDLIPGIGFADDAAAIAAAVASISVILIRHGIHLAGQKGQD